MGIIFRFHNLSWGAPYFFHPDERNIASSVTKLSLTESMNPKFFAYGTLPIYTIYFTGLFKNFISQQPNIFLVNFEDAIIIGRLFSAFFSTLLLFLIYKISEIIINKNGALVATSLASLSVGFIQYSHFATFETWLTFFTTLLLYIFLKYLKTLKKIYLLYIGITLGILISIKISSLIFLPLILLLVFGTEIKNLKNKKSLNFLNLEKSVLSILLITSLSVLVVFLTSPYFWIDMSSFLGSIKYETEVATGKLPVFYTQSFTETIPIFYQLTKVFPFILNPFVFIAFLFSIPFSVYALLKEKNFSIILVLFFFLITFLSQAFLFVKWTRYYIPALPFIYLIIAFSLDTKIVKKINKRNLFSIALILLSFVYSFSFIKTVHFNNFTTILASEWAKQNIKGDPNIVSEVYDMGIVPFNDLSNITLFNFYDLESDTQKPLELEALVQKAEYIILPSQRILKDRLSNQKLYPEGYKFYTNLFNGARGYKKIYETPCDVFCKILYFGDPINSYEATINVFDRPTVFIFKKQL